MPSICFVPNCFSGYSSTRKKNIEAGTRNPILFKAPSDPARLLQWKRAIPRKDRDLKPTDYVCELHFEEHFITRVDRVLLPGGVVFISPRIRASLDTLAVPSKFPNCPSYLNKKFLKRKAPTERCTVDKKPGKRERTVPSTDTAFTSEVSGIGRTCSEQEETVLQTDIPSTSGISGVSSEQEGTVDLPLTDSPSIVAIVSFDDLKNELGEFHRNSWSMVVLENNLIRYLHWSSGTELLPIKYIEIDRNLSVKLIFGNVSTYFVEHTVVKTKSELNRLFSVMEMTKVCSGAYLNKHKNCRGYVQQSDGDETLCGKCRRYQEFQKNRTKTTQKTNRRNKRKTIRMQKKISILHVLDLKGRYLDKFDSSVIDVIRTLQQRINDILVNCARVNQASLLKQIEVLRIDDNMRENIKNCLQIAKTRGPNGIRYTQKWIYECILLKIKNTAAYEHMRRHHMMPLPSPSSISRYLRKLKPSYGFQTGTFQLLKNKANELSSMERHGALLIDEMNLTETVEFNKEYKILGFTDLGKHTPSDQVDKLGNHALVLMYQPFMGDWIQPIGSFLSRGAASSTVLYQIIMEAIILMENSGFHVDVVTTDGAQWNRSMWLKFGIDANQVHCEHIADPFRKLWFVSDFPHLIKNLRNWITDKNKIFKTPDGEVKLSHWEELLAAEWNIFGLKAAYKLRPEHIQPKFFQKMSVALAYQFFDSTVADGMQLYKSKEVHKEGLTGCESTCNFIQRVHDVIGAMSSRTSRGALRGGSIDCRERKVIENFIDYLENWGAMFWNGTKYDVGFLTKNTFLGLQVTLKATLEILDYLTSSCGFSYLMTTRLNQDNLEKFFGMVRSHGGNNDHPTSVQFSFIFKLLSAYSLLRAPRGSNVPVGERFTTFMNEMKANEIVGKEKEDTTARDKFLLLIDDVLEDCVFDFDEENFDLLEHFDKYQLAILEYIVGYVIRNPVKFTSCNLCQASLKSTAEKGVLVLMRDKYGVLNQPSECLMALLGGLEKVVVNEVNSINNLAPDTFFELVSKIDGQLLPRVGCTDHSDQMTVQLTQFYLVMRMNFICKEAKKELTATKKAKKNRKLSKL